MTDKHPITPPPELLGKWEEDWHHAKVKHIELEDHIATQAARWGADQELEACYYWIENYHGTDAADSLQQGRRPKPLSEADQALEAATRFYAKGHEGCTDEEVKDDFDAICRALERLKELEAAQ